MKLVRHLLTVFFLFLACSPFVNESSASDVAEQKNDNTQFFQKVKPLTIEKTSYNIAYYEAGEYWEFTEIYEQIQHSLKEYPNSNRLIFPKKYYYSPGWGKSDEEYENIAKNIMQNQDIDMVIAMGTVASTTLLKYNNFTKPVFCLDIADPVFSGLIDNDTNRAFADNFYVDHIPNKWLQSISLLDAFYDIKSIGTLSVNTEVGRTYANINELREVGREKGFDVFFYDQVSEDESVASCKKGLEYLINQKVESVYIPALSCFDPELGDPKALYKILLDNKIVPYSKDGKVQVMNGAFIGISTIRYNLIARIYALLIMQHIDKELFEQTKDEVVANPFEPLSYINRATAEILNINLPLSLLIVVDGIYDDNLPKISEK